MAKFTEFTNVHGSKCVVSLSAIAAIVYRQDDTAIVHVGSGEIEVHKGVAENLEHLLKSNA